MVVVALVAVAMVTPGENRARRERRHLARMSNYLYQLAALHDRERYVCKLSAPDKPYDSIGRQWHLSGQCYFLPQFARWSEEADWHEKEATKCRVSAASVLRDEQAVRRRLILPVIVDIKRTAQ